MKKNRIKDADSARFSFIDILFSTIGTIIFLIAVNILFIASFEGLMADSDSQLEEIEKSSAIFTPRRIQYGIYGSPQWLNPVLIIPGMEKSSAVYKKTLYFENNQQLKDFIKLISEQNCINKGRGMKKRYSLIMGIGPQSYSIADDLSQFMLEMETDLKTRYKKDFYPMNIAKIPLNREQKTDMESVWEETDIDIPIP